MPGDDVMVEDLGNKLKYAPALSRAASNPVPQSASISQRSGGG